ncbi:MAG TPA: response regulator transcription factor [Candidatus Limnocylindrales bacterium]
MPRRASWLVLALDGPASLIEGEVRGTAVRVVSDPARFRAMLLAERPRIVVCSEPPADRATIDLVIAERRRRVRMRAVHLAHPDAVDARLGALAAGFDDALASTTALAELVGRLWWLEAGAQPSEGSGNALDVGDDLELNLLAHELRRGEEVIHLRPKEFGLLALLAAHPGRAYGRRELLDRVWGPDHRGGIRTVDVHVRWLRSKIEPQPERPVRLVTVRGVGYRLDGPQR